MDIHQYWRTALEQDASAMKNYFHPDAVVRWHNTNEQFTVDEFIQANCEYPDQWDGVVERIEETSGLIITATHVYTVDRTASFHVVSFIRVEDDKISALDEYWGDDGSAPQWRLEKQLGKPIHGANSL